MLVKSVPGLLSGALSKENSGSVCAQAVGPGTWALQMPRGAVGAAGVGCCQPSFLHCSGLAQPCCGWVEGQEAQFQCWGDGNTANGQSCCTACKILIPQHLLALGTVTCSTGVSPGQVSPVLAAGRGEWLC